MRSRSTPCSRYFSNRAARSAWSTTSTRNPSRLGATGLCDGPISSPQPWRSSIESRMSLRSGGPTDAARASDRSLCSNVQMAARCAGVNTFRSSARTASRMPTGAAMFRTGRLPRTRHRAPGAARRAMAPPSLHAPRQEPRCGRCGSPGRAVDTNTPSADLNSTHMSEARQQPGQSRWPRRPADQHDHLGQVHGAARGSRAPGGQSSRAQAHLGLVRILARKRIRLVVGDREL